MSRLKVLEGFVNKVLISGKIVDYDINSDETYYLALLNYDDKGDKQFFYVKLFHKGFLKSQEAAATLRESDPRIDTLHALIEGKLHRVLTIKNGKEIKVFVIYTANVKIYKNIFGKDSIDPFMINKIFINGISIGEVRVFSQQKSSSIRIVSAVRTSGWYLRDGKNKQVCIPISIVLSNEKKDLAQEIQKKLGTYGTRVWLKGHLNMHKKPVNEAVEYVVKVDELVW